MSLTRHIILMSAVAVLNFTKSSRLYFGTVGISFDFKKIISIRIYTDKPVFTTSISWLKINGEDMYMI